MNEDHNILSLFDPEWVIVGAMMSSESYSL